MRSLLELQPEVTLREFLIEKGVAQTSDSISDITDYYSYLDTLLISTQESVALSDEVFTNDVILECIVIHTPYYVLLEKVNKQLRRVVEARPPLIVFVTIEGRWSNHYLFDSIRNMDWWHVSKCQYKTHDIRRCYKVAAERGYELILDSAMHSYNELAGAVAKNSDGSDRYYNLFVLFCNRSIDRKEDTHDTYLACIRGGDTRMFRYLYDKVPATGRIILEDLVRESSYYGRSEISGILIGDNPRLLRTINTSELLTLSYMGGHLKNIDKGTYESIKESRARRTMLDNILIIKHYKLVDLDLLTNLVDEYRSRDILYYPVLSYMDFTLEQYERLWMAVDGTKTITNPTDLISKMLYRVDKTIPTFVLNQYPKGTVVESELREKLCRISVRTEEWIQGNL